MPTTQTVWQVRVYGEQSTHQPDLYHFTGLANVLESIRITWSRIPGTIAETKMLDEDLYVWHYTSNRRVAVEAKKIKLCILDHPTHF